jgi:hypothetical protein
VGDPVAAGACSDWQRASAGCDAARDGRRR